MRIESPTRHSVLIFLVAGLLVATLFAWGAAVSARFSAVNALWDSHNARADEVFQAIADFSRSSGYGGFIHDFNNYVLRRDESYVPKIEDDLSRLFGALDRLDRLLTEPDEQRALAGIRNTFNDYRAKYRLARTLIGEGKDPVAVDALVRVDDGIALNARTDLLQRIVARNVQARAETAAAMAEAKYLLHLGGLILIPVVLVAWLTHHFLRRIVAATAETQKAREQTDLILETAPDPMLAVDLDGHIRRANAMSVKYFGYPRETLVGMAIDRLVPERQRSGHAAHRANFFRAPTPRAMGESRHLKALLASGEERDVAISLNHFKVGEETLVTVLLRDVTPQKLAEAEQKRLNRALRLLGDCNSALVRAQSAGQLLGELCRLLVESGGYRVAWVAEAAQGALKSVKRVASHGVDTGCQDEMLVSLDGEKAYGLGPLAEALWTGRTQVCQGSSSDPGMALWREAALRRGYQSCLALPLRLESPSFAVLVIYSAETDAFGAAEVRLLEELAGNITYGLETLRARRELEETRQALEQRVVERTADLAEARTRLADFAAQQERAIEQERRHLSREVHDQIGQVFTAIRLIVTSLPEHALAPEQTAALAQALDLGIASTRRITAELRPPLLDDLGLLPALKHYLDNLARSTKLACEVDVVDQQCLSEERSLGLFRITQEAVTNVLRHAVGATTLKISGRKDDDGTYRFAIADDGQGFDPALVRAGAMGLVGMRERASLFGGECSISALPERGTVVEIRLALS